MRAIEWYEVQKFLKEQIKYCTERCIDVDVTDKERLINASELRAFERVLNLQGEEPV
jgi:hypothetical protein